MKKLAIILAVLVLQLTVASYAAKTTKKATVNKKSVQNVQTPVSYWNGDKYLLKYNVDDLESAPWLNNGTRKPNLDK